MLIGLGELKPLGPLLVTAQCMGQSYKANLVTVRNKKQTIIAQSSVQHSIG